MPRFNKYQIITMVATACALLFNPMSVEILDDYFKWAYTIISFACAMWVVGFLLKKMLTPEKLNIPSKAKKSKVKTSQYIED